MEDMPSAQSVGREFVRQYYTMMNERPDSLHRFFSHNSSYVHGGIEKPGEEQPPVKGQLAIHQKIMSLGFVDCHAKIRQVDCQETVSNAVVIQVTGELSNNMGPMRRFMQTFVLARQSAKMFYVHNDIFRYQDEVFHDSDGAGDVEENAVTADEALVEPQEPGLVPADDAVAEIQPPAAVSEEKQVISEAPVRESALATEPEMEPTTPATEQVPDAPAAERVEPSVVVPDDDAEKEELSANEEQDANDAAAVQQELPVQKPFSWASLAGKNASSAPNAPATTGVAPKPQAAIKPERKAESTTTPQPLPQRVPRSTPGSEQPVISDSNADRRWTPYDSTEGKQGSGVVVPDNQQLFVGNLPHNVDDKELIDFFSQFGNCVDVKINRKGMSRDLPNFGFVSFDSVEAVSKALAAKPLMLYGKHRINVEEKKEQSELFGRPRGAPRGGRGSFGPYRGSYRGGRGGTHYAPHVHTGSDTPSTGGFSRTR